LKTKTGATLRDMGAWIIQAACRRTLPVGVCLTSLLAGCTAGEVVLYEPEGSGLARGLTVKVELDSTAADIAQALGWTDGVPDAEVRVHRIGTDFRWQTVLADSSGEARFPNLIQGRYRVAGYRVLSDEEAAQVGNQKRAFGDGYIVYVGEARAQTLQLAPDRRGGLLLGELYGTAPYVWDAPNYNFAFYLELYNNSDTTIYLDGMILGWGYWYDWELPEYPCASTVAFRNDPEGVWSMMHHRFPGSGAEYPLAPGEIALVAVDAIDHSQIHPRLPDLSQADFELLGPSDVDNPAVPNLPDIGLEYERRGHGMLPWTNRNFFISESVEIETLLHARDPAGVEYVRFPREALLDVVATEKNDAQSEQVRPPCNESVHRDFDRLPGGFIEHGEDLEYSVQRVVIDYTPDGRAILQDTNTSAVDLVRALYTPGTLPQAQPSAPQGGQ
jgi:hypothetical protein